MYMKFIGEIPSRSFFVLCVRWGKRNLFTKTIDCSIVNDPILKFIDGNQCFLWNVRMSGGLWGDKQSRDITTKKIQNLY